MCAMIAAGLNIYCAGQRLHNVATSGFRRLWFFIIWDEKIIHKLLNDVIFLIPLILRITFQSPLSSFMVPE